MNTAPEDFSIYIEFQGESASKGEIDPYIAGKSLISFSKIVKRYQKEIDTSGANFNLKLKRIYPGSTGIEFIPDIAQALTNLAHAESASLFAKAYLGYKAAQILQIQEFFKGFMNTLGTQVALRISSRGTPLSEVSTKLENGKIVMVVADGKGANYTLEERQWRAYQALSPIVGDLVSYKTADGIERISFGFKEGEVRSQTGEIITENTKYFEPSMDFMEERLREPFDELRAEPVTITGKFVDYYGLAHKYFFSFQVRRDIEKYGRQKILCLVVKERVSEILDLLKPENAKNVTLSGLATRDKENRLDKIKVDLWVDEQGVSSDQQELIPQ